MLIKIIEINSHTTLLSKTIDFCPCVAIIVDSTLLEEYLMIDKGRNVRLSIKLVLCDCLFVFGVHFP